MTAIVRIGDNDMEVSGLEMIPRRSPFALARYELPDWPFCEFEPDDLDWLIPLGLARLRVPSTVQGNFIMTEMSREHLLDIFDRDDRPRLTATLNTGYAEIEVQNLKITIDESEES